MKKLFPLLLLSISCFACEKEPEKSNKDNFDFSYTVDTVMVDPGEEIIYLRSNLNTAALSLDKKRIFNFNSPAYEFEIINLEQLKLEERIKMEKEGPQGTGDPHSVLINEEGKVFFTTYTDVREFNSQLDSMKRYSIRKEKFEALNPGESLDADYELSLDGKLVFAPYGPEDFQKPNTGIGIVSLEDLQLKKVPIDLWERSEPYHITYLEDGNMKMRTIEPVQIDPIDHRVLISSHNFNEVYILDLTTDSITQKSFQSNLTPNSKNKPSKVTVESREEWREIWDTLRDQVEFGRFYYDEHHDKFWRFSREVDKKIGDSTIYKEVTTIFDKDLNQIHEEILPIPFFGLKFFKDGKLYSFVNVEDELGFAVFTFDF